MQKLKRSPGKAMIFWGHQVGSNNRVLQVCVLILPWNQFIHNLKDETPWKHPAWLSFLRALVNCSLYHSCSTSLLSNLPLFYLPPSFSLPFFPSSAFKLTVWQCSCMCLCARAGTLEGIMIDIGPKSLRDSHAKPFLPAHRGIFMST